MSQLKVSRRSLLRTMDAHTTVRIDLVFVANGKAPQSVAVSVSPMVPEPGAGYKILDDREICDCLQRWGFAIDEEMEGPKPTRTVNAAQPIPIFGGRPALMELLAQEFWRFFSTFNFRTWEGAANDGPRPRGRRAAQAHLPPSRPEP